MDRYRVKKYTGIVSGAIFLFLPCIGHAYIHDYDNLRHYSSPEINSAYQSFANYQNKSNVTHKKSVAYKQFAANSGNSFIFNPRTLQWKALHNGRVVRTGHGSAGKSYCPDIGRSCKTPTGTFSIISKGGSGCKSSRYPVGKGGAPMPYCMFFSKNYAIHGSPDVPNYNASHGCVRVNPGDARWLNQNFLGIGSKVVIQSY